MRRNLPTLNGTTASSRSKTGRAFADIISESEASGTSVFLFGANPAVIYSLRERLSAIRPGLRLAGICDGDFEGPVSADIVAHIRRNRPDIVLVDLVPRRFEELRRDHAELPSTGTLINLPGAFEAFLEATGEQGVGRARGPVGHLGLRLASASRFPRILLRQFARERLRALGALLGAATATQHNR